MSGSNPPGAAPRPTGSVDRVEVQRATNRALFDSYVMVDWSASSRSRQGRDSIWVAVVHRRAAHDPDRTVLDNPATRHAGSVGSQALTGIPVVEALRDHPRLASVSQVWPFETGLSVHRGTGARIVHAEIWPGAVPLNPTLHPVRDAAQVLTLARHLAGLDRAGTLARWFAPRLETEQTGIVIREEGWILGS